MCLFIILISLVLADTSTMPVKLDSLGVKQGDVAPLVKAASPVIVETTASDPATKSQAKISCYDNGKTFEQTDPGFNNCLERARATHPERIKPRFRSK